MDNQTIDMTGRVNGDETRPFMGCIEWLDVDRKDRAEQRKESMAEARAGDCLHPH